jgi:hypothetical protein
MGETLLTWFMGHVTTGAAAVEAGDSPSVNPVRWRSRARRWSSSVGRVTACVGLRRPALACVGLRWIDERVHITAAISDALAMFSTGDVDPGGCTARSSGHARHQRTHDFARTGNLS